MLSFEAQALELPRRAEEKRRAPGPVLPRIASSPGDRTQKELEWRCAACGLSITRPDQAFATGPGGSTQVFPNPLGQLKVIVTVRDAWGCHRVGEPTREFTWFEGYFWTVVLCDGCGAHLGWHYQGEPGRSPAQFYGLLTAALREG